MEFLSAIYRYAGNFSWIFSGNGVLEKESVIFVMYLHLGQSVVIPDNFISYQTSVLNVEGSATLQTLQLLLLAAGDEHLPAHAPAIHADFSGGREGLKLNYDTVSTVNDPKLPPREPATLQTLQLLLLAAGDEHLPAPDTVQNKGLPPRVQLGQHIVQQKDGPFPGLLS